MAFEIRRGVEYLQQELPVLEECTHLCAYLKLYSFKLRQKTNFSEIFGGLILLILFGQPDNICLE